jgi:hypothetical protein
MLAREIPSPFIVTTRLIPPRAWLPKLVKLRDLMLALGGSEIATVEALCREIAGDYVAGDILNELLRLFPMGIRADGGVWKEEKYWKTHFALSRYKMNKARAKLAPFIRAEVIKSGKAPTWHYWPKPEAIVSALAKIYGKSETFIEAICFEEVEVSQIEMQGFVQSRNTTLRQKSITSPDTGEPSDSDDDEKIIHLSSMKEVFKETASDNEIVGLLVRNGVWRSVARAYADLPRHEIEALITRARAAEKAGKVQQDYPGYLAASLKNLKQSRSEDCSVKKDANAPKAVGKWSDFASQP